MMDDLRAGRNDPWNHHPRSAAQPLAGRSRGRGRWWERTWAQSRQRPGTRVPPSRQARKQRQRSRAALHNTARFATEGWSAGAFVASGSWNVMLLSRSRTAWEKELPDSAKAREHHPSNRATPGCCVGGRVQGVGGATSVVAGTRLSLVTASLTSWGQIHRRYSAGMSK
jgi:hypothetical protein